MKNFEKIKNLSVDEMAEKCLKICQTSKDCVHCVFADDCAESDDSKEMWRIWLESEAMNNGL